MLAALVAAGALASCGTTSVLDAAGGRGHRGVGYHHGHHHGDGGQKGQPDVKRDGTKTQQATEHAVKASAGSGGGAPGSAGTERTEPVTAPQPGRGTGAKTTRPAVSCFDDGTGDLDGTESAPSYADLRRGCVREDGSQLQLEATTVAATPARMPDKDTDLAIGFQLTSSGKKYYVSAEETENGWTAYLTQGSTRRDLPPPTTSGALVRVSVPLSALGDARRLDWRVESSWLRTTLTSTEYAFDDAPNGGGTNTFSRG